MSTDDLLTEVEEGWRGESRLIAHRMAAVAELLSRRTAEAEDVDDDPGWSMITGYTRTAADLGALLNMAPADAGKIVGHAEALDQRLPRIAALLAAGHIDWQVAKQAITRTQLVSYDLIADVDQAIAETLSTWRNWSRRRVNNLVDRTIIRIDPDAAKERRITADTQRNVSVTAQPNGMAVVRAYLRGPAAVLVDRRLTHMATTLCCTEDPRTLDQRRTDAFEALGIGVEFSCGCGRPDCGARAAVQPDVVPPAGPPQFLVNVIASQGTVTGESDEPGYLDGYGVIDADQVRQLTDQAQFRTVAKPDTTTEQAHRYHPSTRLARWIRVRDLTCRFPGCDRLAWRADLDHTQPFDHLRPATGGPTAAGNLGCYCRLHHRMKTFDPGWRDTQHTDGTITWTSPTGRTYTSTPDGADLFDDVAAALRPPRDRTSVRAARTAAARAGMAAKRAANADTRALNRARAHEIDIRTWRNNMRRARIVFKGGHPSTSPYCPWANEPLEDEHIGADWKPPPPPMDTTGDDPPF
jgi:hypothetical protein